ncbi:MAG: AraC-like DNA-binding protein [Flavobacteriales bacterium]|jgi:AraC-like DNA-binding protein
MKLYIKNMVCARCIMVVKSELEALDINPVSVKLGEVELLEDNIDSKMEELIKRLHSLGFEWLDDKKSQTIEKIKNTIIQLVHYQNNNYKTKLSEILSREIGQEYSILSHLFSEVENTTIEKFYINQKIEKVKELLVYDELTLSEISYQLNYSSVAHLSSQFKKVTGFTPSHFKDLKDQKRNQIENL